MGLFDRVIVRHPLPLPLEVVDNLHDIYDIEFQTKDLENYLEDYILDEDGRFFEVKVQSEWVDDDESFLKGYFKAVKEDIIPSKFHGVLNFYCYERLHTGENRGQDVSLDYLAKFNDGGLVDLELLSYEISDASEDIVRTKEFFKKLEIEKNKWYNKFFLQTKPISFIRKKIIKFFGYIHNLTGKLHTFVIRHL